MTDFSAELKSIVINEVASRLQAIFPHVRVIRSSMGEKISIGHFSASIIVGDGAVSVVVQEYCKPSLLIELSDPNMIDKVYENILDFFWFVDSNQLTSMYVQQMMDALHSIGVNTITISNTHCQTNVEQFVVDNNISTNVKFSVYNAFTHQFYDINNKGIMTISQTQLNPPYNLDVISISQAITTDFIVVANKLKTHIIDQLN